MSTKGLYWDINLRYQSWEIREVYKQLEVEAEQEIQKFIWDLYFEIPNLSDKVSIDMEATCLMGNLTA